MAATTLAPAVTVGAVVFTDIVGFTEFTALRGDEEAVALLSLQEQIVAATLPAECRLVKEIGDGLLLWFPDAAAAVDTTLRLQERFEAEAQAKMVPLWVRIGVHYGQQWRRRDDIVGHDVNVAARIVDVAGPGEVVASEAAVLALGGRLPLVRFDELGPVVMKGIPEPIRLFRAARVC